MRLGLFACSVVVVAAAVVLSVRRARRPELVGVMALAVAPMIPHVSIAFGVGFDDVLPLAGLVVLFVTVRHRALVGIPFQRLLLIGVGLLAYGYLLSIVVNADGISDGLSLALRSIGRLSIVVATGYLLLKLTGRRDLKVVVARAVAGVATAQAVVGVLAYLLPNPDALGLEETRRYTVLHGEIPGRINGLLNLSPDFLGALFVLSIPLTLALAMDTARRRTLLVWTLAAGVQVLALLLTYVRASLGLVLVCVLVLVVARSSYRILAALGVVIVIVLLTTPTLQRLGNDRSDRYALWYSGAQVMLDYPVGGVGIGQMKAATARDPERYRDTPFGPAVSNAHNTIILAGAEEGMMAMLGSLLINLALGLTCLRTLIQGWPRRRQHVVPLAAALGCFGFLVQGMVNNLFTVTVTANAFVLVITTLVIDGRTHDQSQVDPVPGSPGSSEASWTTVPVAPERSARTGGNSPTADRKAVKFGKLTRTDCNRFPVESAPETVRIGPKLSRPVSRRRRLLVAAPESLTSPNPFLSPETPSRRLSEVLRSNPNPAL